MKKVLLIALFGATCVVTPALAEDQDLAFQPAPPPRPATAPAAPAPAAAPRPAPATAPPAAPAAPVPAPPQGAPPPAPAPPAPCEVKPERPLRCDDHRHGRREAGDQDVVADHLGRQQQWLHPEQRAGAKSRDGNGPKYMPTINIPLNVDVRAVSMVETGIRATVTVEYQPYVAEAKTQPGMVSTNATTVFNDGRKTQILVTADPISDRKTTIEVTATVLK